LEFFSVFIRVSIKFPQFGISMDNANGTAPTPLWNLFTIDQMLEGAKALDQWENIAKSGAAIAVIFQYNCNLDLYHQNNPYKHCLPEISFLRIDSAELNSFAAGYNFRYTYHYYLPNNQSDDPAFIENRDLFKVYGIRFIFLLSGKGGKFNIVPLIINIGSGLALLGIATFVADLVALYILPKRKIL